MPASSSCVSELSDVAALWLARLRGQELSVRLRMEAYGQLPLDNTIESSGVPQQCVRLGAAAAAGV